MAVRYLKAYTKKLNYESEILEVTINDSIENIVRAIILKKPNIVGFSTYIWNLEYVEKISRIIKEIDSNIEIFYGGPEVSYDSLSFLSNSAGDYVIEGEGEETFYEFMKNKINGDSLNSIKGLYIKNQDGSINYAGQRALIDMNSIVFPYNDKDDLKNKIVYYEASRGCPFRCKYCLSSTTHGVRFLPVERVKRELKFLIDQDVKLIKFVDRTFNCNSKFAMEIWRFLIEEGSNTCFHFEISADILKHEDIELLAKAK
ncbi:MAG: radical SAM protein, partial [Clostridium sp.]|uniref:B12-binding domain-containing radical SAM protein n=1 Tax=Clostridium sp. TaxID=1506 RepID=UPI0029084CF9|nr:radical SAM protein [Clostridium sp.]